MKKITKKTPNVALNSNMSKKEMSLCLRRRFNFTFSVKDFSPLHVVKFLLTLTDNPNPLVLHYNQHQALRGQTPIFMAAERGLLDVVKVLCQALNERQNF